MEGRVLELHSAGFTYREIKKILADNGIERSLGLRSNVINCVGANRQAKAKNIRHERVRMKPVRTPEFVLDVSNLILRPNPPAQRQISVRKRCSLATVNRSIRKDLGFIAKKKIRHPHLSKRTSKIENGMPVNSINVIFQVKNQSMHAQSMRHGLNSIPVIINPQFSMLNVEMKFLINVSFETKSSSRRNSCL